VIRKVVARRRLGEPESDVEFWRSRPAAERIAHVEALRAEHYGLGRWSWTATSASSSRVASLVTSAS
jgi:hypothetical protein